MNKLLCTCHRKLKVRAIYNERRYIFLRLFSKNTGHLGGGEGEGEGGGGGSNTKSTRDLNIQRSCLFNKSNTTIATTTNRTSTSKSNNMLNNGTKVSIPSTTLLCTTLDSKGRILGSSVAISKPFLCLSHGLLSRDIRKLDGTLKTQLPALLVRSKAILVNFDTIQAIIKSSMVIIIESPSPEGNETAILQQFIAELQVKLFHRESGSENLPFEFIVLETILLKVCANLQEKLEALIPPLDASLRNLEKAVHWDRLQLLLENKRAMHGFEQRVNGLKEAVSELLNSDDDMSSMYLTEKESSDKDSKQQRDVEEHEEVELLLENYLKILAEFSARASQLLHNIHVTEETLNIGLIGQRNELLLLEIKLSISTFALSMGGFGAGLFGMNLQSGLEHHRSAFFVTASVLATLCIVAGCSAWRKMRMLVKRS